MAEKSMLSVEIDNEYGSYPCDFPCSSKEDAIFEAIDGELCPSVPPSWLEQLGICEDKAQWTLTSHIPFLECFLPEATHFWSTDQDGHIVSDFWTQTDSCGDTVHLLAYAVSFKGKKYLLIRAEDALYKERERLQQYAHEAIIQLKLAARWYRESKDMATSLSATNATLQLLRHLQQQRSELATRISGEEYGITLPDMDGSSAVQVGHVANKMVRELQAPYSTSCDYVATSISIGMCTRTSDSETIMR
jgi:hypothetical protein